MLPIERALAEIRTSRRRSLARRPQTAPSSLPAGGLCPRRSECRWVVFRSSLSGCARAAPVRADIDDINSGNLTPGMGGNQQEQKYPGHDFHRLIFSYDRFRILTIDTIPSSKNSPKQKNDAFQRNEIHLEKNLSLLQ